MKTKILLSTIVILGLSYVWTSENAHTNSSQPPLATTGAPGDNGSCARSGCHIGSGANTGPGAVMINFADGATTYLPNTVYDMEVVVMDATGAEFGFELVALDANENSIGEFINGASNTNIRNSGGREYIHHTNSNTNNRFTFQWMSPSEPATDVTFYVASNAANGNNSRTGDQIYTADLIINQEVVGISDQAIEAIGLAIAPNPIVDQLQINYTLTKQEAVNVQLMTIDGRIIEEWALGNKQSGIHQERLMLTDKAYTNGLYLLKWTSGTQSTVKKVMIK